MAISEARKRANNKWTAANMAVLGCKVRKDKAEDFKTACKMSGTSPNAVFIAAIDQFMAQRDNTPNFAEAPQQPSDASEIGGGILLPPDVSGAVVVAASLSGETPEGYAAQCIRERLGLTSTERG